MRAYAERQGWTVLGEFIERGVSGRTTDRPALRELLARCKAEPKVDVVLVHKIDRLARNVYDHATIRFTLKQLGIKLASVVENVDDSVSGQLLENIMAALAQWYSQNLSGEVRKGMEVLVSKGGWPHKPPRGYKLVGPADKRREIVIDDGPAAAIRRAFELYATGSWALRPLREELKRLGIVNPSGRAIPIASVRNILQNAFYAGRVRWHEAEYQGNHEPLVSPDLFDRVQHVLRERHQDAGSKGKLFFLLRGVAFCTCGARMTAERHGRWEYYRCVTNTLKSAECRAKFVNVEKADRALTRLLRSLTVPDTLKRQMIAVARQVTSERAESLGSLLSACRARRAKFAEQELRLTEAFASGAVSLEAYKGTVAAVRAKIAACDRDLSLDRSNPADRLTTLEEVLRLASSLWDCYRRLDQKRQAGLVKLIFKRLTLDTSGVKSFVLNPPFDMLLSESQGDPPTEGLRASHLEERPIGSTIIDIFELHSDIVRQFSSFNDAPRQAA